MSLLLFFPQVRRRVLPLVNMLKGKRLVTSSTSTLASRKLTTVNYKKFTKKNKYKKKSPSHLHEHLPVKFEDKNKYPLLDDSFRGCLIYDMKTENKLPCCFFLIVIINFVE